MTSFYNKLRIFLKRFVNFYIKFLMLYFILFSSLYFVYDSAVRSQYYLMLIFLCFSDFVFKAYNYNVFSILPIYKKLIEGGLKIWIYRYLSFLTQGFFCFASKWSIRLHMLCKNNKVNFCDLLLLIVLVEILMEECQL